MKNIKSRSDLESQLDSAGTRLVVIDFFATWCGPCKTLAPVLESLEKKYGSTIFAKVDVDEAQECATKYEVSAMPTILFFKSKAEVGRVVGADAQKIEALIKTHQGGDSFVGTGQTLGGGSSTQSGSTSGNPNVETIEGPGGSCQIQVRLLDGSAIRGQFEPTHTVQRVHEFVRVNLDARGVQAPGFTLMSTFPTIIYKDEALHQTLQDAKLAPRAQLIVKV
ncbi:thioredoxin 1 [Entomortierella parvispora]|uniref:Thioredoxin 1 n=1 Tax=Entomortierella parvispora TaxID=205924 RepID=A0A9P3HFQ1_9FUNG|nr:thioredoxin 1 [Entomortierella parvispora]